MFKNCISLTSLDLSNFDTSSLKYADLMFSGCEKLETINQHFTSESLESSTFMFSMCKKLKSLDLSGFKGEKITSIFSMFSSCFELRYLDLSNFDCRSIQNYIYAFYGLPKNGTLKYNSDIFNSTFLSKFPKNWIKIDVKKQD